MKFANYAPRFVMPVVRNVKNMPHILNIAECVLNRAENVQKNAVLWQM
jgi:hypothetical protein